MMRTIEAVSGSVQAVGPDPFLEARLIARAKSAPAGRGSLRQFALAAAVLVVLVAGFLITGLPRPRTSDDLRHVNYVAIERFLVCGQETASSYALQPTQENRSSLAGSFYDFLEDQYGIVDERLFRHTYAYLESNINELI
jgi:hypothetical protein